MNKNIFILLILLLVLPANGYTQRLPSEVYYEQEISSKYTYPRYDQGNSYTNQNDPNNNYTNNEMYVQRIESYFEVESGYMENPHWNESWSNLSHLISMFGHLPNFEIFKTYMFSDYFSNFWSNINNNKSDEEERHRFYQELRYQVNSPIDVSVITILALCIVYIYSKKLHKRSTPKNT